MTNTKSRRALGAPGEFLSRLKGEWPSWLVAIAAALTVGTVAVIVGLRVTYPYDLEWMEGAMVEHVLQLMEGKPLYAPPSLDFTAYIYNPLFFWVGYALATLFGPSLPVLRLISVAATLACMAMMYGVVKREGGSRAWAALGVALFAGTYPHAAGWFELARVDMLYLALALGAFVAARYAPARWVLASTVALAVLTFLAKQVGLVLIGALALVLWLERGWRTALTFALVSSVATGAIVWLLSASSGTWYEYYAFELPAAHGSGGVGQALLLLRGEVLTLLPLAVLLCLALCVTWRSEPRLTIWFCCLWVALGVSSAASRVHAGGSLNTWIPLWCATALGAGLAATRLVRAEQAQNKLAQVLALGFILQLALLTTGAERLFIPSAANERAGAAFVEQLAQADKPVWLVHHGNMTVRAGKRRYAHAMALIDVLKAEGDARGQKRALARDFETRCRQREFDSVIVSGPLPFTDWLRSCYGKPQKLETDFWSIAARGGRIVPNERYHARARRRARSR